MRVLGLELNKAYVRLGPKVVLKKLEQLIIGCVTGLQFDGELLVNSRKARVRVVNNNCSYGLLYIINAKDGFSVDKLMYVNDKDR